MGVLERISSMLGRPSGAAGAKRRGLGPNRPVEIDLDDEGAGAANSSENAPAIAPRSRQEMIVELQRSYAEVVELVRKVDNHLDRQETRATRLMEIAEQIPAALESLPRLETTGEKLTDALDELRAETSEGDARLGEALGRVHESGQRQTEQLGAIHTQLEVTERVGSELNETMGAFRASVDEIAGAERRVAETISQLRRDGERRENELTELAAASRRSVLAALIIAGVALIVGMVGLVVIVAG